MLFFIERTKVTEAKQELMLTVPFLSVSYENPWTRTAYRVIFSIVIANLSATQGQRIIPVNNVTGKLYVKNKEYLMELCHNIINDQYIRLTSLFLIILVKVIE